MIRTLILSLLVAFASPAALADIKLVTSGKNTNFLYERDPKSLNTEVTLIFRTGYMHDPEGKAGLAYVSFLSLLRGTEKKNRQEWVGELERLGGTVNVATGSNRSSLTLTVIDQNLEPALDLLAEATLRASFPSDAIESMLDEEKSKLNQEKSSSRTLMSRAFRLALFKGTPLAYPPTGTPRSLDKITRDDIRAFIAKHLVNGNAVFAVASRRPQAQVKQLLESRFAPMAEGPMAAEPAIGNPPAPGIHVVIVPRPGLVTTEMLLGQRGIAAGDKLRLDLETANYMLGDASFVARMFVEIRVKNGWAYGAYSSYNYLNIFRKHPGAFGVYANPRIEVTSIAVPRALEIYQEFVQKGLTDDELSFAKKSQSNSYAFRFATPDDRLGNKIVKLLDNAPLLSVTEYRKRINAQTKAGILKALQARHNTKNTSIVIVGDEDAARKAVANIKNVASVRVLKDPMDPADF